MWTPRLAFLLMISSAAFAVAQAPARIPWNDSKVVGSPEPPSPYKVVRAFPKLNVKQPLALLPEPGTNRLFILQHLNYWAGPGRILTARDDQNASETETLLEIDGLAVGLALHPKYLENGYLYVGLNGPQRADRKKTQVFRYTVDRRTGTIDPATKLVVIEWVSNGHNGGDLAFGNDGYLYVSSGDGSSDSDADLTGQTLNDLLGCVVRIDVDKREDGRNYAIPKDNPFVDRPGARGEIWAYGLRNPWRLSYDPPSGQLWIGNNGQDIWEQVYLIKKGGNYGWSVVEGSHVFHSTRKPGPDPILTPAGEHHHSEARSITGGRVYRGKTLPDLVGTYLYGDWSTGRVWGIKHDGEKVLSSREIVDTPFNITGFGTDHAGELYVIDQQTGCYRFEPTTDEDKPKAPFPTKLSQTGLFSDVPALKPHAAALPYEVAAKQWADGATMSRFIAIPGYEKIEQKPQPNAGGAWTFPNGTVLAQTLRLKLPGKYGKPTERRIETRLLVRQQREWTGYSYRWNEEQTDAELVPREGAATPYDVADASAPGGTREQIWRFPSRAECMICHSRAQGFVLGFSPAQLDRKVETGGTSVDQLDRFEKLELFEGKLPARGAARRKLVDPYDAKANDDDRVRSYLHVNCSTCHVKEGGGNAKMELGIQGSTQALRVIDVAPQHSTFEIQDAKLVAPGAPERSILYQRITRRGTGQMPPLVTTEVDKEAAETLARWIKGLTPAKP